MKNFNCILLLILSVFICKGQSTFLSHEDFRRSYFVDGGVGVATSKSGFLNLNLNAELNKGRVLAMGATNISDWNLFSDFTKANLYFIGLGQIKKSKNTLFLWSLGPSYTYITHHDYEPGNTGWFSTIETVEEKRALGVHAKVQLLGAWKVIGGGFTAFVNLNTEALSAGFGITAAIGRMHFLKTH